MEIGAAIFFTNYSMAQNDLAVALEQRGFDSLWVAEHSHMPVTRRFTHPLGEAALTKEYFDVMDPFVTLSIAARRHQAAQARHRDLLGDPARYDTDC
jgi:alkanesulfonate monooxygenase SsuD/methylene tetrahydromethanopterin reductase-like flavin-dependent oxidoreductase (luciferase family)